MGEDDVLGTGVSILVVGDNVFSGVSPDDLIASLEIVGAGVAGMSSFGAYIGDNVLVGAAISGMLVSSNTATQSTPPKFGPLPHAPTVSVRPAARSCELDALEAMASPRSRPDVPPYGANRTRSGGRKVLNHGQVRLHTLESGALYTNYILMF